MNRTLLVALAACLALAMVLLWSVIQTEPLPRADRRTDSARHQETAQPLVAESGEVPKSLTNEPEQEPPTGVPEQAAESGAGSGKATGEDTPSAALFNIVVQIECADLEVPRECCDKEYFRLSDGRGLDVFSTVTWRANGHEGVAEFEGVPAGRYLVRAPARSSRSWSPERVEVWTGDPSPRFVLETSFSSLRGHFVDEHTGESISDPILLVQGRGFSKRVEVSGTELLWDCWPRSAEGRWYAGRHGYIPARGDIGRFLQDVPAVVELEHGWGRFVFLYEDLYTVVAEAKVYLDGVDMGRTDEEGMILLHSVSRPRFMAVHMEGEIVDVPLGRDWERGSDKPMTGLLIRSGAQTSGNLPRPRAPR